MGISVSTTTLLLLFLLLVPFLTVTADNVIVNAGGPAVDNLRCDTGLFFSKNSRKFALPEMPKLEPWHQMHRSARIAAPGEDLVFRLPVPAGKYDVWLIFCEFDTTKRIGQRTFRVTVNQLPVTAHENNGQPLDIVQRTGGVLKPLFINAWSHTVKEGGAITVKLARVKGDPIISGVAVRGADADALIGSVGLNSCHNRDGTAPSPAYNLCPTRDGIFINAGGSYTDTGYRCDKPAFTTGASWEYSTGVRPRGKCADVYSTHRVPGPFQDELAYNIPVPPGKYKLHLLFMETYWTETGKRVFRIEVNGKPWRGSGVFGLLDVYAQVGLNKPLRISLDVVPYRGVIRVVLSRVADKDNPMISAIAIVGSGADRRVGSTGLQGCAALPLLPPKGCTGGNIETDFRGRHVAHAVSGGPYLETDFDKDGRALVHLEGTGSHSHASEPSPGNIVWYEWQWRDPSNPRADTKGNVIVRGARPKAHFPQGVTSLSLIVQDNHCNSAKEVTTVTVEGSTRPGAYCYYYDFGFSRPKTVPLPFDPHKAPKPLYALQVGDINFANTKSFGDFAFKNNAFAVRCVFAIEVGSDGMLSYDIVHNGPVKIYSGNTLVGVSNKLGENTRTTTVPKFFVKGTHSWQILYFRQDNTNGQLSLQFKNRKVVPSNVVRHDASTILPVITGISKSSGLEGQFITITGSAFVNGVVIKFGDVLGEPVVSTSTSIQLRIPPSKGKQKVVDIVIETEAGTSNGVTFTYGTITHKCRVPKFTQVDLLEKNGQAFQVDEIAVAKYGPDGRLYLGSTRDMIYALRMDRELVITHKCSKNVNNIPSAKRRWILGLAFDPSSPDLRLYFSSSTIFWKENGLTFTKGWANGRVQSIMLNNPSSCFNSKINTVVSGLPVSAYDHGVNWLQFTPSGKLLISVGGMTNGGVWAPNDKLGGVPPSPYSGSVVECPVDGTALITYSNYTAPDQAKVMSGGCDVYAAGLRNSFGAELHTNGHMYASDNGPNIEFGDFAAGCNSESIPAKNVPDRLLRLERGKCHGHPNIPRARNTKDEAQCVFNSNKCVRPLVETLTPSTNGVLEYRSNAFDGALKSQLLLARFSDAIGKKGSLTRIQLNNDGGLTPNGVTPLFEDDSGLSIVEGPRGELIMPRVYKKTLYVLKPACTPPKNVTRLLGVHPNRGPAQGGLRVLVSGFGFGPSPVVMFGPNECGDVKVIDDEALTCVPPRGTPNTQVKVVVKGTTGENVKTSGADYWMW